MNYYFLIATLPEVNVDSSPAISTDEFIELCKEQLTPGDFKKLLKVIDINSKPDSSGFVKEWNKTETIIRNTIARIRASKMKIDPEKHLKENGDIDFQLEKSVEDALNIKSPLDREKALDKIRLDHVDSLTSLDPFSVKTIFAYAIKLKIAERWTKMKPEKGKELADIIINAQPSNRRKDTEQTA